MKSKNLFEKIPGVRTKKYTNKNRRPTIKKDKPLKEVVKHKRLSNKTVLGVKPKIKCGTRNYEDNISLKWKFVTCKSCLKYKPKDIE